MRQNKIRIHKEVDGWMDRWIDGGMDRWMDGWMEGKTDIQALILIVLLFNDSDNYFG